MAADFFRVERGYEINETDGDTLVQIITDTAAPNAQADAVAAPVGTLWIINAGTAGTTRVYQKWQDVENTYIDWREINTTASWREPARVRDDTLYANSAAFPVGGTIDAVALADGDRVLFSNVTASADENIWIWYAATTTWFQESNSETDGDMVVIQEGTSAGNQYLYDGTNWVAFGGGSSAEEGFIRAFIGKDAAGAEKPNYESPSEGFTNDEAADRDPFTDATGVGTAAASMGYVAYKFDNLELAVAKLNQEMFQNNRHLYAAAVTSLVDTVPAYVDGCIWIVRILQGANAIQWVVHGFTQDGTNVDYNKSSQLKLGVSITGADAVVTVAGSALVLTVSSTAASTIMIRRLGTLGVGGAGAVTGFTGALHVYS
jgi:hypothetical protein